MTSVVDRLLAEVEERQASRLLEVDALIEKALGDIPAHAPDGSAAARARIRLQLARMRLQEYTQTLEAAERTRLGRR